MFPPVLKMRSLSTDDGGDESILFAILFSSGKIVLFAFLQSMTSTSSDCSGKLHHFAISRCSFRASKEVEEDAGLSVLVGFVSSASAAIRSFKQESKSNKLSEPRSPTSTCCGSVSVEVCWSVRHCR